MGRKRLTPEEKAARATGRATKKRARVQLDLSTNLHEEMKRVVADSRSSGLRDMLTHAFRIFRWYIQKRKEGYEIAIVKDGKTILVDFGFVP